MKKFDLYIISFKEVKKNNKIKKEVQSIQFYERINFELAKGIGAKYSHLRPLTKQGNVCLIKNAYKFWGYVKPRYGKGGTIIICEPSKEFPAISFSNNMEISIHPLVKFKTLSNDIVPERTFQKFEELGKNYDENFFDYSIERSNIWLPNQLIPKGFYHVNSGLVEKGDYYWEDYYSRDQSLGNWTSVDVSYSSVKVGYEIEERGIQYSGKHSGRKENEVLKYPNEFIIRKNK